VTHPITTHSVEETMQLAARFAATLKPGQCIALDGQLGAGKTQFVRGLVTGLGGDPRAVSSPTYVLLHIYPTPRFPVHHLDAYRVAGPDDFESIGFTELLDQNALVVVEWPSRIQSLLPESHIQITIQVTGESTRVISIRED
jgi:tRNA threonylcarbamoyladenosine biosynthesis protein TsaE